MAAGEAGDRPRRCSAWSSLGSCTSCCVGSLGVASGSDLPSCLLEYNCLLLIFFFLNFPLILWHSYPTQIPHQSCNLGSLRKQRTDHLQISSVYYESVPMPCVIPIFFLFNQTEHQRVRLPARPACRAGKEGAASAEILPAPGSVEVTAHLSLLPF